MEENHDLETATQEVVIELEDNIDLDQMKEQIIQIENCKPLKDNWVRECLV